MGFHACGNLRVAMAPVRAMRVNCAGEFGWEFHHSLGDQGRLFDRLMDAGAASGIRPFGAYALASLRLEKSHRLFGTDLPTTYSALESGLDRFVRFDREFVGRDALCRQRREGLPTRRVTLKIDTPDRDAFGDEPIRLDGRLVGRCTSGGYAHWLDHSMALGYVEPLASEVGTRLEVELLGDTFPAEVVPESPFDPNNERPRS